MKTRRYRMFCADFETTVYAGQDHTEVWASALVEIGTEDVVIDTSLPAFMDRVFELAKKNHLKIFFQNLKFDGSFILDYLINKLKMKQAYYCTKPGNIYTAKWYSDKAMINQSFKYLISDMGQWYMITICIHNHIVQIVDSFKLIPFSVENIGKSFETKHKKLSITYEGERHAGDPISVEERSYIRNDVLVMAEALAIMFDMGHTKLTIGACCLAEFRKLIGEYDFHDLYPNMVDYKIDQKQFGAENADQYIRRAYRGGWCYLVRGKECRTFHNGITLDVNSLYPSVMSCGNVYPYGSPHFWKGDYIPDEAKQDQHYFYIRIRTRFEIKPGFLPTIQIKNSGLYAKNEYLESSKIKIGDQKYSRVKVGCQIFDDRVTLTLTMTDYNLFLEHYHVWDFEILDGCWFYAHAGDFDSYIEKYKQIKTTSTGARRTLAKLYLNNLYGKLATGENSSYKIAYPKEDGSIGFVTIADRCKKVIYIPAGAAVTAYAREFTIRAAQANYYGVDQPGFIYADTDSLHLDIPVSAVQGVKLHDTDFCCWAHESSWHTGLFLRQKTYIEISDNSVNVTACGMGKRCKELIAEAIEENPKPKNDAEKEFFNKFRTLDDFRIGLEIPSNLKQHRIPGGVILTEDMFCLR